MQGEISEHYDKLLIASGSYASIPPIKNLREAKRVYTLRDLDDAIAIKEEAKKSKSSGNRSRISRDRCDYGIIREQCRSNCCRNGK